MTTTALNLAYARHHALLDDLDTLGEELGNLSTAELRTRMIKIRGDLSAHFAYEEQNGYLNAVRIRDPNRSRLIDRLKEEHRELRESLDALLWRFEHPDTISASLKAGIHEWVRQVRSHETRENELIQDAFGRDAGTCD